MKHCLKMDNENNKNLSDNNKDESERLPKRWEIELEFVQSLSNIQYLNHLLQNNYLSDERFLLYLKYLEYWKNPKFSQYIVYPNCLHILTLLKNKQFRKNIRNENFRNTLMNDMVQRWQNMESDIFKKYEQEIEEEDLKI